MNQLLFSPKGKAVWVLVFGVGMEMTGFYIDSEPWAEGTGLARRHMEP